MTSSLGTAVVMGQGYVGLPVAMRAVHAGFDVVGFDTDQRKINALAASESYVEDISAAQLRSALDSGRFRPSSDVTDLAGFDFCVISVPTPLHEGNPMLKYMESAAAMAAPHLRAGATVILESTTYPGTTEELIAPILEAGSGLRVGSDFHLGYSPERIDPGNVTYTFENTPKVVSGVDAASLERVQWFFDQLVDKTVAVRGTREAELTKLLENTFRHVNIALVNELAIYAHGLGIDVWDVIEAANTKPFGFMKFTPGPGVGGHCLPIDPSYLSWQVRQSLGQSFRFVELANDVNNHMPDYVIQRITSGLNRREQSVRGRRVLLAGMAYKANTGDARETPVRRIAKELLALGATVAIADPHVPASQLPQGATAVQLDADEIAAADAIAVLVDHSDFDFSLLDGADAYVLDCRNIVDLEGVERL